MGEAQPILSNAQLIGYTAAILGGAGGVISLLFWRYIASLEAQKAEGDKAREREVAAARSEAERAWQLVTALRLEASESNRIIDKLGDRIGDAVRALEAARSRR